MGYSYRSRCSRTRFFVRKTHANAFYKTNLKEILDQLSVNRIEFCGAQTEYCMDATIKFAHGLGYENFMGQKTTSTLNNPFMSAKETIDFMRTYGITDFNVAKR